VDVERLSKAIHGPGEIDSSRISPPGLLYLENRYVVPGGRFNEMYGWDSYFIILGLLQDGRTDLARGMVENFFFEIEHYGTVLNANRTYYLTRSQPPFLSSMVMAVYDADKKNGKGDLNWLRKAYGYVSRDYQLWIHEPHLAGSTGLSRYYDFGEGPTPESLKDETHYYRKVAASFMQHPDWGHEYLVRHSEGEPSSPAVGFSYNVDLCDSQTTMARPECQQVETLTLSPDYYKGDRSMRESGFDVSFRFGPFSAATHHYAAVCLNSLLYKTERDLQQMSEILGQKEDAAKWKQRSDERARLMQTYFWDQSRGMFFDYNFETKTRSTYEYITTFYPLWAGLATPEQAKAVEQNLGQFEKPGGLLMSRTESGGQWDYPYGWAPTELLAIGGLRRYGYNDDANRVSYEFLSTVAENFRRDGTIREKYNVVTRSSETPVTIGYAANVVGFGWTNGAFLELLHALPGDLQQRLSQEQDKPLAAASPKK
jgi:alpha,alpha-trehalase